MTCVYELEAVCACPVDKAPDYYRVTVRAGRCIPVEDILKAVKAGADEQYQEAFTEALSRALGAEVQTVGFHSGVKATVTCGAE